MTRFTRLSVCLLAATSAFAAAPAVAQDATECTRDRPVISLELPNEPCTGATGIKINRGPEVAPTPSDKRPVRSERAPVTQVILVEPGRERRSYRSGRYIHKGIADRRKRPASGFNLVVDKDDFYLRIGRGGGPYVYRHDSHPHSPRPEPVKGIYAPGTKIPDN